MGALMSVFKNKTPKISEECVENPEGLPGVIVYDNESFPIAASHDIMEESSSDDGDGDDGYGPSSCEDEQEALAEDEERL